MKYYTGKLNIAYTVCGTGQSIIMLHGNGEDKSIFDKASTALSEKYQVYCLDSRCHGESDSTVSISYDLMADDVVDFIKGMNIKKPIIYGFSDGGIIALLIAIKRPDITDRIIISGANTSPKGLKSVVRAGMAVKYFFTRDKLTKMMLCEPNIKRSDLNSISAKANITCGSNDIIKFSDTKFIADNIPNSTLKVFSHQSHGSYIVHSDIIAKYIFNTVK